MKKIIVSNLSKSFGDFYALKNLSVEFQEGEKCVIYGSSGSGKSTLLYLMGGLDRPSSGEIVTFGKNLNQMNDSELALYRNEDIGFIFQFHFLLGTLTGLENILLPAQINRRVNLAAVKEQAMRFAQRLGVSEILHKLPTEMSGGQQQRINIIRALSLNPKLLLCDEPTGNLDSKNSAIVIELLNELADELGTTLIIVTHDRGIASQFDRQIEILDGGIGNQEIYSL